MGLSNCTFRECHRRDGSLDAGSRWSINCRAATLVQCLGATAAGQPTHREIWSRGRPVSASIPALDETDAEAERPASQLTTPVLRVGVFQSLHAVKDNPCIVFQIFHDCGCFCQQSPRMRKAENLNHSKLSLALHATLTVAKVTVRGASSVRPRQHQEYGGSTRVRIAQEISRSSS